MSVRADEIIEVTAQVADRTTEANVRWPSALPPPRPKSGDLQTQAAGRLDLVEWFYHRRYDGRVALAVLRPHDNLVVRGEVVLESPLTNIVTWCA